VELDGHGSSGLEIRVINSHWLSGIRRFKVLEGESSFLVVDPVVDSPVINDGLSSISNSSKVGSGESVVQGSDEADNQFLLIEDFVVLLGVVVEDLFSKVKFSFEGEETIQSILVLVGIIEPSEEVSSLSGPSSDGDG